MTLGKLFHKSPIISIILRRFENQQQAVQYLSSPKLISMNTGCYKPCSYQKYSLVGEHQKLPFKNLSDGFMLWSFANDRMVGKTKDMNIVTKVFSPEGGEWAIDLPLAVSGRWIWRISWPFPWVFLDDHLGFCHSTQESQAIKDLFGLKFVPVGAMINLKLSLWRNQSWTAQTHCIFLFLWIPYTSGRSMDWEKKNVSRWIFFEIGRWWCGDWESKSSKSGG